MKSLDFIGLPKHCITTNGKVFSLISNRFLSNCVRGEYISIGLYVNGCRKTFSVHRLVAMAYIPNPEKKPIVNHKDGDKFNNQVSNLEWCTASENAIHAVETGLKGTVRNNYRTISEETAKEICALLQDGYRVKDVAMMCNVKSQDVSDIKCGKNYKDISSEFTLDSVPFRQRISVDKILKVCELLQSKTSMAKIKQETGLNLGTIRRIKNRETNTFFSSSYIW